MARFSEALNRSMETISRPPPPPQGHYVMSVTKVPDPATEMKGKDGTLLEKYTIPVTIISAHDDVDTDELAAFGNVAGTPLRIDFIFNTSDDMKFEGTLNRLKEFMDRCGVDVSDGVLMEKVSELVGAQFLGQVTHRLDPNDASIVYAEVGKTYALG